MENEMDHGAHQKEGGFFASRANIALIGFLVIAAFFLVTEHRAHLIPYLGYWPFLLLLACPLLHVFMHGGHGGHGGAGNADDRSTDRRQNPPDPH
jgi:hypothetical protein